MWGTKTATIRHAPNVLPRIEAIHGALGTASEFKVYSGLGHTIDEKVWGDLQRFFGTYLLTSTGIQITGTDSNITSEVKIGDMVEFTVHTMVNDNAPVQYRFFTRAGYGELSWGGNQWEMVQDFSSVNSVSVTFDQPGTYFLACHVVHAGDTWKFGDPQTGIAVEVSEPSGTGIQITGASSTISDEYSAR